MRVFVAGGTGVHRASSGAAAGGPWPPGDRDDDERGQAGAAGAAGRRGRRDGRAGCGVGGRGGGRGPAGRDREPDDGPVRGARRQAQPEEGRPLLRHHQPAPQRGDRPPAGRGRGDRCLPHRRAGPRQHERNPQGRMGQDRGGPAGGAGGNEGDQPPGGRGRRGRRRGSALRRVLRAGRQRRADHGSYGSGLFPLVGGGTGYVSWVHVDDAASATVLAVEQKAQGVFNIVDDEPAPVSEWLPYLAECAGAKPPRRVPAWLARLLAGDMAWA